MAQAAPVEDLGITLLAGRVDNAAPAISQAIEAERLGLRRVWMPERYTNKEVGVVLGAIGASTSRIGLGAGPMSIGSRPPIVTAAIATTLQSMFGGRCSLGMGRGASSSWYQGHGFSQVSYREIVDIAGILKSLWRGETVDYHGPAGRYEGLTMVDLPEGPPPTITFFHMGGRRASQVAAQPVFDHSGIVNITRPEVTAQSLKWSREEAERLGRDPDTVHLIASVTTAPDLDEDQTLIEVAVRILVYLSFPVLGDAYARLNGWDPKKIEQIRRHAIFDSGRAGTLDQNVARSELVEAARVVPESWCRETAAIGSVEDCLRHLQRYRDAGAAEINLYGSTPAQNADLVTAWRERTEATR